MNSIQELLVSIRAGYSFFYLQTEEFERAINLIKQGIGDTRPVLLWDYASNPDPNDVITSLGEAQLGTVMIAKNWDWFLKDEYGNADKGICSTLLNLFDIWTTSEEKRTLIIVGNVPFSDALPSIIASEFKALRFTVPGREEVRESLDYVINSAKENPKFNMPAPELQEKLISSAIGMTARGIVNAYSYSVISTDGSLDPVVVSECKAQEVEQTPGIAIGKYEPKELRGYMNMTDFVLATMDSPLSKGVLLIGPPGTGKTTFARNIGARSGRIVFEIEMAELFGGLVGDSEKLWKRLVDIILANAPCIVFIDEIEKGLAGAGKGDRGSDPTTMRSASQFLKFMSDTRPEGVYVIATCNNIDGIDPEWLRAGRWDSAPWFVDLPEPKERELIWEMYTEKFDVAGTVKDDKGWSGAEIETCCTIASETMMNCSLDEATEYIIPVSVTKKKEIDALREFAKIGAIPATKKVKVGKGKRQLEL